MSLSYYFSYFAIFNVLKTTKGIHTVLLIQKATRALLLQRGESSETHQVKIQGLSQLQTGYP